MSTAQRQEAVTGAGGVCGTATAPVPRPPAPSPCPLLEGGREMRGARWGRRLQKERATYLAPALGLELCACHFTPAWHGPMKQATSLVLHVRGRGRRQGTLPCKHGRPEREAQVYAFHQLSPPTPKMSKAE